MLYEGEALFQRSDWASFALAIGVSLTIYILTLSPEVTLEMSGILSTAALYGGVAHPPGFPLWTLYAWLFTQVLPFSNIAWRVSVSSAVAGALTCGMIALMVSRVGAAILDGLTGFRRLDAGEERVLRTVAGFVAGMGFGFNNAYWLMAVTVETKPLTIAVLTLAVCLLLRWSYATERRRYLFAGFFAYGLSVSASPIVMPAALALPFFVMFFDAAIGRELFFAAATIAFAVVFTGRHGWLPLISDYEYRAVSVYFWLGVLTGIMWLGLLLKTRGAFTAWKPAIAAGCASLLGVAPYLWLPLASMTTLPSHWGYARTAEGFFHLLRRGQFESITPTVGLGRFFGQLLIYAEVAWKSLGWPYLLVAPIPFLFVRRMRHQERAVILGVAAFYLCLSCLVVYLLNPPPDRSSEDLSKVYFTPSYVMLTTWSGIGLILLGSILSRKRFLPTSRHGTVSPEIA